MIHKADCKNLRPFSMKGGDLVTNYELRVMSYEL